MIDTLVLLLSYCVTTANISDNQGAKKLVKRFHLPCIQKVWVDQACIGYPLKQICPEKGLDLKIVKRSEISEKILLKRRNDIGSLSCTNF